MVVDTNVKGAVEVGVGKAGVIFGKHSHDGLGEAVVDEVLEGIGYGAGLYDVLDFVIGYRRSRVHLEAKFLVFSVE